MQIGLLTPRYRLTRAPSAAHAIHVVKPNGLPDYELTAFACRLLREMSADSVPKYVGDVLKVASWAWSDPIVHRQGWRLLGPSEEVRHLINRYLTDEVMCRIVTRPDTFGQTARYVHKTADTKVHVRRLCSALKRLFNVLIEEGLYKYPNPLIADGHLELRKTLAAAERKAFASAHGRPRMPQSSGVDSPSELFRLSENYFRCIDEQWVPRTIDDENFPSLVYAAGHEWGWTNREFAVTRTLFESGGRVSEVCGLTIGDWSRSRFLNEFSAKNKGSHGLRTKFLICAQATAKILRTYFDDESGRRGADRAKLRLAAVESSLLTGEGWSAISQMPLFLSARGTEFSAENFRQHFWKPALQAFGLDADPHQARHWFVTQALRVIMNTSRTENEVQARKRELILYMKWRSSKTIESYSHIAEVHAFLPSLEEIHRHLAHQEAQAPRASISPIASIDSGLDEDLAFILGEDES